MGKGYLHREYISVFIKNHLRSTSTDYAASIHRRYVEVYTKDVLHTPYLKRPCSYNSFAKRVARLMRGGLIERTGEVEHSKVPTAMDRVYLRLTRHGAEADDNVWIEVDHNVGP